MMEKINTDSKKFDHTLTCTRCANRDFNTKFKTFAPNNFFYPKCARIFVSIVLKQLSFSYAAFVSFLMISF